MTHLYIYALCYSMHRLVVPSGNESLYVSMTFSLLNLNFVCIQIEQNKCVLLPSDTIFHENSQFMSFKLMRNGSLSSNVYQTLLSAVICTLNPPCIYMHTYIIYVCVGVCCFANLGISNAEIHNKLSLKIGPISAPNLKFL